MYYRLGQGRKLGLCHGQMSSEVGNRQDRRVGRRGQERSVVKLFERHRINPPPRTSARLTAKCHENACFCQLAGASLSDGEAFRCLLKGDRLTEPLKQWGCEVYIHHAGLATGRVSVFSGLHLPASYQVVDQRGIDTEGARRFAKRHPVVVFDQILAEVPVSEGDWRVPAVANILLEGGSKKVELTT